MKFSIITASFNQAAYIQRSLASVQLQTHRNFEHIIHDGLSTDGSQDILRSYANGNTQVRLVIEKDNGQVQAINNGLQEATGEVLTWLNTDDFLFNPQVLELVSKEFEDPTVDVVYGRGWYVDEHGQRVRDVYVKSAINGPADLISSLGVFQPALYFRRRVFERLGGLDPKYQLTLDYEYWIRMLQAGIRFRYLDTPLAKATLHEDSKTVGSRGPQLVETLLLLKDRYGYVHPDWIDRFVSHLLYRADWTSKAGREAELSKPKIEKVRLDHELCFLSGRPPSRLARLTPPHTGTAEGRLPVRRVIVTSFDSNYFAQGLNLISSIHVHARHTVDRIVVYALGLTSAQRGFLAQLEGVIIESYPADEPWPGYFSPKSYMYKCHAISDVCKHAESSQGEVLWIDAGVCVTGPLDDIFDLIQTQGVFLVNHDDRRSRTMINAAFTHPLQTEHLGLDLRELGEDHVCSCVLGYRMGSPGATLVEEVAQLSLREEINHLTKHPDPKWLRAKLFEQSMELVGHWRSPQLAQTTGLGHVADFPYYGHRQDQSLYSNIAARMGLPVSSALSYCPATDYSSKISYENWKSGGEATSIERSTTLPEGHTASLFHHRGTYSDLTGLLTDRSRFVSAEVAFVLGNGPSLKALSFTRFRNIATIGMNAAYRYWDDCGWYPSYYCCMDTVVILSHAEAIYRLINSADTYGIRCFFLRKVIADRYPDLLNHPRVLFLEDVRPLCPLFQVEPITTGSYSLMFLAFLGFRQIYLAGVDCNYVERIDGIADGDQKNKLLVIEDVKSNPNYFFDSYQRSGDEYNVPNPSKDLHVRSWRNCATMLAGQSARLGSVRVINLNQLSKVDCFENDSVVTALQCIDGLALNLAKAVARTFGAGSRTNMINAVQRLFSRSLGSTHYLQQAKTAEAQPLDLSLRKIDVTSLRNEIRLRVPLEITQGELVTAVFEFVAMPCAEFFIQALNINAWDTVPRIKMTLDDLGRLTQTGSTGIYIIEMRNGRYLLLINLVAAKSVRFEGLTLEVPDATTDIGRIVDSFSILAISTYRSLDTKSPRDVVRQRQNKNVKSVAVKTEPIDASSSLSMPNDSAISHSRASLFQYALSEFRNKRYSRARDIAAELANNEPDFRWYQELVNACDRKLSR